MLLGPQDNKPAVTSYSLSGLLRANMLQNFCNAMSCLCRLHGKPWIQRIHSGKSHYNVELQFYILGNGPGLFGIGSVPK
jgi:hypothetical protein